MHAQSSLADATQEPQQPTTTQQLRLTCHMVLLGRSATSTPCAPMRRLTVRAPAASSRCTSCCGVPGPTIDSASASFGEKMSASCSSAASWSAGGGVSHAVYVSTDSRPADQRCQKVQSSSTMKRVVLRGCFRGKRCIQGATLAMSWQVLSEPFIIDALLRGWCVPCKIAGCSPPAACAASLSDRSSFMGGWPACMPRW